jgi:hypothetical protein
MRPGFSGYKSLRLFSSYEYISSMSYNSLAFAKPIISLIHHQSLQDTSNNRPNHKHYIFSWESIKGSPELELSYSRI